MSGRRQYNSNACLFPVMPWSNLTYLLVYTSLLMYSVIPLDSAAESATYMSRLMVLLVLTLLTVLP